jgi:hypothetical protein
MYAAQEYRHFMKECLRWAATARSEEERGTYLQMAKTWHEAALELEQSVSLAPDRREAVA